MTLAVVVLLVLVAVTRLWPGMRWRWPAKDSAYHMLLRRELRRRGLRMPDRVPAMLLEDRQSYPWLYHQMIALLPDRWLARLPSLPSAIADAGLGGITLALAAWIAPRAGGAVDPTSLALVSGVLFATSPALLVAGIGPRAHDVTPRPFGELWVAAALALTGVWHADGSVTAFALGALAGGAALLTSKFAAQALLFMVPVMAMVVRDASVLLLLPGAVLLALVVSAGRYRHVLRAQVAHLGLYRRRLQHEHVMLADRNDWGGLARAVVRMLRSRDRASRVEAARLAEHNTWLQFLLRNMLLVLLAAALLAFGMPAGVGTGDAAGWWLLAWAAAPLVPFVLTSLRGWRFLGEAERYPEYGVVPTCVLAALLLLQLPPAVALAAGAAYLVTLLPSLGYGIARRRFNVERTPAGAQDALVSFLGSRAPGEVVLPVPWHAAFAVAPVTEQFYLVGNDGAFWTREFDRILVRYPWPVPDLAFWRQGYGASLLLVERALLEGEGRDVGYDLSGCTRVHRDARYDVYEL